MDTTHLEYAAEDLISHRLMRAGLLVAKPKFDREGADLLAFRNMADGVKFCRIQCKGRNVRNSDANVQIPTSYVTNGFVFLLYVDDGSEHGALFCFLASAIREWNVNSKYEYQLHLSKSNFRKKLALHVFDSSKIDLIKTIIERAEITDEFGRLVYGQGAPQAGNSSVTGEGGVSS